MTNKQYNGLKIGEKVSRINGPNKDIPLKVINKYFGIGGTPCLSAEPVDPNVKIYVQNISRRNDNKICGAMSTFKLLAPNS